MKLCERQPLKHARRSYAYKRRRRALQAPCSGVPHHQRAPRASSSLCPLNFLKNEFVVGLAIFAVMPTTNSSGVVLTGLAKGNVGLSLVLSVATNILGVFTVPVMLTLVVGAKDANIDLWKLLGNLCLIILLPVVIGKLCSFIGIIAKLSQRFDVLIKLLSSFFLVTIPYV